MKRIIGSLLVLFAAVPLQAQSVYTVSRFFHVTGAALDLSTTLKAEQNPNIVESNPILGRAPARQIVLESGLTFLLDRITNHMAKQEEYSAWKTKGHPKRTATILNFIVGSVHFAAGSWNIHVTQVSK